MSKQGTPTMGGLMFIIGIGVAIVICGWRGMLEGSFQHLYVYLFALVFGAIGYIDDYQKVKHHQNTGLTAPQKFILQLAAAVAFLCLMRYEGLLTNDLYIPFVNVTLTVNWIVYLIFAAFVIVGTVNAVNITDGIDGLSSSVTLPVAAFFAWEGCGYMPQYLVLAALPVYQGDRMLATICSGVIGGIGDALIYMQNSSTGGLDFITMAIKSRHPHMPFGNLTFAAALAVILANGLVFHDVDSIIYGLIFNFLTSYIINRMMFGFNACMMALIVTSDGPAVCRMIGEKVDRGSTILKGYGGYSQDGRDVVLCACSSKQLYIINRETKRIDPGSFIVMLQANEVEGEGFKRLELGEQS